MYGNFCLDLYVLIYVIILIQKAVPKKFGIWAKAGSSTPALGHTFASL